VSTHLKKNTSTRSVGVEARFYNNPAGLLSRTNAGASISGIPGFLALEDAVMQREQDSVTP
jgi:hypothetical protein